MLCKSGDVRVGQDARGVCNLGATENGSLGGKKGYIYSGSGNSLFQLVRYDNFYLYSAFCSLMNTKQPSLQLEQPPGTS